MQTFKEEDSTTLLESLQRTMDEIEALTIIYNKDDSCDEDDNEHLPTTSFTILSVDEYNRTKSLIAAGPQQKLSINDDDESTSENIMMIPTFRVEINLVLLTDDNDDKASQQLSSNFSCSSVITMTIHISLPKGYPNRTRAIVSIVSISNLKSSKSQRDEFSKSLNEKAMELAELDSEALLELTQYAQDHASRYLCTNSSSSSSTKDLADNTTAACNDTDKKKDDLTTQPTVNFSRRWIWVHHITNKNRCKDIVQEAQTRNLCGYLKSGYPGIIVIEGETRLCNEYITWVKGNKSRPGGFGRNWGHHVRGEVELQSQSQCNGIIDAGEDERKSSSSAKRAFFNKFMDIGEDLSDLGSLCRQVHVENEFKQYVMQH